MKKYNINFKSFYSSNKITKVGKYFFKNGYGVKVVKETNDTSPFFEHESYDLYELKGNHSNYVETGTILGYLGMEGIYNIMKQIEKK
mgnify:FL=1